MVYMKDSLKRSCEANLNDGFFELEKMKVVVRRGLGMKASNDKGSSFFMEDKETLLEEKRRGFWVIFLHLHSSITKVQTQTVNV